MRTDHPLGSIELNGQWKNETVYRHVDEDGLAVELFRVDADEDHIAEQVAAQLDRLESSTSAFELLSRDSVEHPRFGDVLSFACTYVEGSDAFRERRVFYPPMAANFHVAMRVICPAALAEKKADVIEALIESYGVSPSFNRGAF